jgi:hypothetical protein
MSFARLASAGSLLAVAVAVASGCGAATAPAGGPTLEARPHPVITIVVDQMAGWMAEERWPLLPRDGGFARLAREGSLVRELRYAHAVTDTAPGHSALYTGASPRASGICINEVLDATGKKVSILRDERTALVGAGGPLTGAGAVGSSLAVLEVDTLADRLRASHPDALIVSLSLKDRGALFGGGRRPTASLWLDVKTAQMVCSTAVCDTFPAWAVPLGSPSALAKHQADVWTLLDPGWVQAHAATPDMQDGEGDIAGLGVTFPHPLSGAPFGKALRTTPMADELLFALATAALDAESRPGRPTLLALSLSANDYIGHTFGPDSWESWDELSRLDRSLARFLASLDARFGADGYDVLLTADHGVTTMPEATLRPATRPWCSSAGTAAADRWGRACGAVTRILPEAMAQELTAVARTTMGDGSWVLGVDDPYVFLTPQARALPPGRMRALKAALTSALQAHAEVAAVFDVALLPATCPPDEDESLAALVCRSSARSSGDLYVVPRPGSFFDPDVVVGKGTSHGGPYLYDRAVPLLVRAPGRVPAHQIIEPPVGFSSFTRTAASLLGIPPPDAARSARDLSTR